MDKVPASAPSFPPLIGASKTWAPYGSNSLSKVSDLRRSNGAAYNQDIPRPQSFLHSLFAKNDFFNLIKIQNHKDRDSRLLGNFKWASGSLATQSPNLL